MINDLRFNFRAMLEDQRAFNRQVWTPSPSGSADYMERLRVLTLGDVEETLEFLRTFEWKSHRRRPGHLPNVSHTHEELIDKFKYLLSLMDLADFPFERLEELYYAKSRVVQYRYQEEWAAELKQQCVVVDIDNVLADYVTGICRWAREHGHLLPMSNPSRMLFVGRLDELERTRGWVNAESTGVSVAEWARVKHEFRSRGGKLSLPLMPSAASFLRWCRSRGWAIILITSRPVDQYPNIFTETLTWLTNSGLDFDYLWWSGEKGDRLASTFGELLKQVVFTVDDDPRFVSQYRTLGVKSYWLNAHATDEQLIQDHDTVRSLDALMEKEMVHV